MDASDPQSLASSLKSMLSTAFTRAVQTPNPVLQSIFNELPSLSGMSTALDDGALNTLRSSCASPDWSSVLLYVLTKIEQPLRPSWWLGAAQPVNWSQMLTLNYSPDAQFGAVSPTPPVLTIGVALSDSGAGLARGVWVNVAAPFRHDISYPPSQRLAATLAATEKGSWSWQYPFDIDHPPNLLTPGQVSATATVTWSPGWGSVHSPLFDLSLGGLSASIQLASADPMYHAQVGFGPLGGTFTPQHALGDGLAARLASLGDVSVHYTPSLVIADGSAPTFSLGN